MSCTEKSFSYESTCVDSYLLIELLQELKKK